MNCQYKHLYGDIYNCPFCGNCQACGDCECEDYRSDKE